MMKKIWTLLMVVSFSYALPSFAAKLNTGPWRFELKTTHAIIPFIIDFKWNKQKLVGTLHNGKEKIPLRDIKMINGNEISIPLQTYEISLELKVEKPSLVVGYLVRHNKNPPIRTPLKGMHGSKQRFKGYADKAKVKIDGTWALDLIGKDDSKSQGIGHFKQKGKKFTGSILTPTGDYRYLEGVISGQNFQAASFDGVYNYLFSGTIEKGKLKGAIASNSLIKVEGILNKDAALPDAYKQTTLSKLSFRFPDLSKKMVSLEDEKFKGKPVIVQIFGSWCPNCMDEMNFLIPWYKENAKRGIEVVALAFERSLSYEAARTQLLKVQKKKKVPYTLLIAGSTSEEKPEEKIPGLKNFISFPTTIFLDKKHQIYKVHAGFSGPGTGKFFDKWKEEFNQNINELLK